MGFLAIFYKVVIIGFSSHNKFYVKYRPKLDDAMDLMIENMLKHENNCFSYLRKTNKFDLLSRLN
jgi:hypothetical protein